MLPRKSIFFIMSRLLLLLLSCTLCSCDPGFSVILTNNSGKDRTVKVIENSQQKFESTNTMRIASSPDSTSSSSLEIRVEEKDATTRSYSFMLQKGNTALLQRGLGFPNYQQKIIIDNNDTIFLTKDKRVTTKRKFM